MTPRGSKHVAGLTYYFYKVVFCEYSDYIRPNHYFCTSVIQRHIWGW